MPFLELRHVTRRYGTTVAVDDVSLQIDRAEFFTLLGPSGCGKTTLLRMIGGFEQPDAGSIWLDGQDVTQTPAEHRPVCTVFQSYALFPHMTVAQNVGFGLRMSGQQGEGLRLAVAQALDGMGLTDRADHWPHQLSGGQRQRVALARAMVNRPSLLLLDEPLAALDAKLREDIQVDLINLQREAGITFLYVTHAQQEALALSHRIAVMRAGRVEQLAAPADLYAHPANRFVADFIGQATVLDAVVRSVEPPGLTAPATRGPCLRLDVDGLGEVRCVHGPTDVVVRPGTRGCFVLRPEQVSLGREALPSAAGVTHNRVRGQVRGQLYTGDVTVLKVETAQGANVDVQVTNAAPDPVQAWRPGDRAWVHWPPEVGLFLADAAKGLP